MNELELKLLNVDPDAIKRKLERARIPHIHTRFLTARYFDTKQLTLAQQGKQLRVRNDHETFSLTLKHPLPHETVKGNEEHELHHATDVFTPFLEHLGFHVTYTITKQRSTYQAPDASFVLDHVLGIPPYLEIEATTEEVLYAWIDQLQLPRDEFVPLTMQEVIALYH